MASALPRPVNDYEIRLIPFSERGPIAAFQLEVIEKQGCPFTLDELDDMDLLALVHVGEEGEDLKALAWLLPDPDPESGRGFVAFNWVEESVPSDARSLFIEGFDDWARDQGIRVLIGYTFRPVS